MQVLIGRASTDGLFLEWRWCSRVNGRSDNIYLCADSALIRNYDKAISNELIDNLISKMAVS
jgi:hypothetical protein